MKKRCYFYKRLLSRRIDGDLGGDEAAILEDHLKQCPDCRAREQRYTRLREEIKNLHTTANQSWARTVPPMPGKNLAGRFAWKRSLGWITAAVVIFIFGFLLFVRSDSLNRLARKNPLVYEPMRTFICFTDESGAGQKTVSSEPYNPMSHYIARVDSGQQINRFFLNERTVNDIISEQ